MREIPLSDHTVHSFQIEADRVWRRARGHNADSKTRAFISAAVGYLKSAARAKTITLIEDSDLRPFLQKSRTDVAAAISLASMSGNESRTDLAPVSAFGVQLRATVNGHYASYGQSASGQKAQGASL
jgi:hypothetical protein